MKNMAGGLYAPVRIGSGGCAKSDSADRSDQSRMGGRSSSTEIARMQNPVKGSGSMNTALHLLTRHAPSLTPPETANRITDTEWDNGTTGDAVAESGGPVHHLINQMDALREENLELRKSAQAFGDLAERLSEQLRKESAHRARLIMSRSNLRTRHMALVQGQHVL
jgi:hypothetical protein